MIIIITNTNDVPSQRLTIELTILWHWLYNITRFYKYIISNKGVMYIIP